MRDVWFMRMCSRASQVLHNCAMQLHFSHPALSTSRTRARARDRAFFSHQQTAAAAAAAFGSLYTRCTPCAVVCAHVFFRTAMCSHAA